MHADAKHYEAKCALNLITMANLKPYVSALGFIEKRIRFFSLQKFI
jgi:hypothetical protein